MSRKIVPFLIFVILLIIALITVKSITTNSPPKVNSKVVTAQEDTPVSIMLLSDNHNKGNLIYKIMSGPSHGTLSGTEPNLIYTPNPNFHGVDNFSFKVSDGKVDSTTAIISISVASVNDEVEATDDSATVREDAAKHAATDTRYRRDFRNRPTCDRSRSGRNRRCSIRAADVPHPRSSGFRVRESVGDRPGS